MIILSHRGYWLDPVEKNTKEAFVRSFQSGFGTETDIRDLQGRLVISHDPPQDSPCSVEKFLEIYKQYGDGLPLALNIKSDGLQTMLQELLVKHNVVNYFVFDMSVPDMLQYFRQQLRVFGRQSEYEPTPSCYDQTAGIWMDCFQGDWFTEAAVAQHRRAGKKVCLVSPDLHKRDHQPLWNLIKDWSPEIRKELMLCTDHPEEALRHFEERN